MPIILPAWMWGPGDPAEPGSSGALFLGIARGQLRALPSGARHVVDVRDVVDAFVRAASAGESGRRYIVGGRRYELGELFGGVADAMGAATPMSVPASVASVAAAGFELVAAIRGGAPIATRTAVKLIGVRERLSSERAERELGVSFRPLADTIRDEAAWFDQTGRLPASDERHRQLAA